MRMKYTREFLHIVNVDFYMSECMKNIFTFEYATLNIMYIGKVPVETEI